MLAVAIGLFCICYAVFWHWTALVCSFLSIFSQYLNPCTGSAAAYYLQSHRPEGKLEATSTYHILAFYISGKSFGLAQDLPLIPPRTAAGLFSGLVSHVVQTRFVYPRLVAKLASPASITKKADTWAAAVLASTAAATKTKVVPATIRPSFGSSGAVYAVATLTALGHPNAEISLYHPPTFPISVQYGVGAMVAVDLLGILRGWRYRHLLFPLTVLPEIRL